MEWYDPTNTKKLLTCIMSGCVPCTLPVWCKTHDKPALGTTPHLPAHCKECGEYILSDQDRKGMR